MHLFRADYIYDNYYQISGQMLEDHNIKLLLADLDNTLISYDDRLPDQRLQEWKDDLAVHGVTLFVLSNSRKKNRPDNFSKALNVPYIAHAGKPGISSFIIAMKQQNAVKEETAIIGDQIFTDVLGGNRAGVKTILVEPIRLAGNPGRYLRYAAEIPFRWLSGRGK